MDDWSNLADEASKLGPGPRCQVQDLLNFLPGEQAEKVEKALANKDLTHTGLHRAIKSRLADPSHLPSMWSIGNHRRGNCRCAS